MAQTMDANPLKWAELIEFMETDSDLPSECALSGTAGKSANKTETKPVKCKQISDNDLRKKLNKNRCLENEDGLQATTSKSGNRARSVDNKCTQGRHTNDLRMKLNRKRGEAVHDSNEPQREKHSPSGRSKYTERHGGLSPLRSPIDRSKQKTIFDIDNSRNFRFTKNRGASSEKSVTTFHNGEKKDYYKCMRSPSRSKRDKCVVKSDGIYKTPDREESDSKTSLSDCDRETPGHSLTPRQNSRQSWSRRKLLLPSESNGPKDVPTERIPEAKEDDELKLARREKDIVYGKNTLAYQLYINEIPLDKRVMKVHPRTPDKFRKCSRRSWDSQVKIWKRRLHALAAELNQDRDIIDILRETHLRVDGSSSDSKTDDEDFLDFLDDNTVDLLEKTLLTEDA